MVKSKTSVVKIDSELLGEVEEFINLEKNKFKYASNKQFIDLAVAEKLQKILQVQMKQGEKIVNQRNFLKREVKK